MMEFYKELNGPDGPVFLKMNHLARETVAEIERILHTTERPSRGRFHIGRGTDYGERLVEMAVSEIGLCSGHSASGVWVNECGETTLRGLYAAGDMASVPHNVKYDVVWHNFTSGPPLNSELLADKLDIGNMADFPAVLGASAFRAANNGVRTYL